ncbi:MAG: exodeoxyribonuclease III [Oscillospiraceae bacterium]|nr:exodeoxyribonuclease III [Oscillospiraceae bacterium]
MRFVSWNVNGLRACLQKGFLDFFNQADADFFCLQETKLQPDQISLELPGYEQFWNSAEKKGYSGTAIFTKHAPLNVRYGIGVEELDHEGRLITLEYPAFYLVTCYTPNAQDGLKRLDFRIQWEDAFRNYLQDLDRTKPVIACGDLNVAHEEIDLKNPATNHGNPGFSDEERGKFTELLAAGFLDSFRDQHPDQVAYSWWSYRMRARERDVGWRIDYFVASSRLRDQILSTTIHSDIFGSDHCPVGLEMDLSV